MCYTREHSVPSFRGAEGLGAKAWWVQRSKHPEVDTDSPKCLLGAGTEKSMPEGTLHGTVVACPHPELWEQTSKVGVGEDKAEAKSEPSHIVRGSNVPQLSLGSLPSTSIYVAIWV